VRTGQAEQPLVGHGRLAQVEHLELEEVLGEQLQAGVAELRRPQVQVAQRRQLDQVLGARRRHIRERQAQPLQVAERAAAQQHGQVRVLRHLTPSFPQILNSFPRLLL